jgi:glutamate formiminotransferase
VTLECVINLAEGRNLDRLAEIGEAAGRTLLDLHHDPHHHRSVFTLAATDREELFAATKSLGRRAVELIDLSTHEGVHPRLGVLDVVPFSPVGAPPFDLTEAEGMRARFARFAADELSLPVFLYGSQRSLPEIRRRAFTSLEPDLGPPRPSERSGACCVGAREPLVAFNVVLATNDLALARRIATVLRSDSLRTLALRVGDEVEVSCNLITPFAYGPAAALDGVRRHADVARCELVGLVPDGVLRAVPRSRWQELDLDERSSLEVRLAAAFADGERATGLKGD